MNIWHYQKRKTLKLSLINDSFNDDDDFRQYIKNFVNHKVTIFSCKETLHAFWNSGVLNIDLNSTCCLKQLS